VDDAQLRRLVRDLIDMGVGLEVTGGVPDLTVPESAEAMVLSNGPAIRAAIDRLPALWAEAAVEKAVTAQRWSECGECKAAVAVPKAWRAKGDIGWAFCESLFCPYRTDAKATAFRKDAWQMKELARQRQVKALADDPTLSEPIPD